MKSSCQVIHCGIVLTAFFVTAARANNIDLSTVPQRNSLQLTIYNSEDLTLVRETRVVTFKKGVNPLEFSWANTLIDPTSVELKFINHADKLDLLDTTFPHDKPQKLYWNVQSDFDGEATIQITYFTSGISWSADYLCIANKDESKLGFEGFVRITNNSGEDYDDAHVRLVVGNINLVEKIAQLAKIPMAEVDNLESRRKMPSSWQTPPNDAMGRSQLQRHRDNSSDERRATRRKKKSSKKVSANTSSSPSKAPSRSLMAGPSVCAASPPKASRSKSNIATARKNMASNSSACTCSPTIKTQNSARSPLPDGSVRLFRDNGRDGLTYLTQQQIKYIPIGDKIELNLGADPNVIFELTKPRSTRDNIWVQLNGRNEYRQIDGNETVRVQNTSVAGWDDHFVFDQRIRNYTDKPIDVEIRRTYPGHVLFRSQLEPTLYDFQTVQFQKQIPAGQRADCFSS